MLHVAVGALLDIIMRYVSFFLSLCFGIIIGGCTQPDDAGPDVFDPRTHDWPHDISDITPDPGVIYGKLDNGMRYALRRNARPENEAVLRFRVFAGARHETDETLGIAHYLEHMAFNGSENVPEGEMVKSLERLGLSFGADTNASTTFTRTQYMLNLPDVDDETVDYALLLMRETADRLLIEPDAVDRERGVVKAEEARGNTPGREASRAYLDFMYPGFLQTMRPVIGLPETLDTISSEQLRGFYQDYYRPERTLIVMVGDIDPAIMEAKIKQTFSDWTNTRPNPEEPELGELTDRPIEVKIYSDDELTTQITLFDNAPTTNASDTYETRKRNFARAYANAIVNQRIRKKLLSPDAPVLGASIGYYTREQGDQRIARGSAKDEDWPAVIELLDAEIRTALEYGFQQNEYDELMANTRRSLTDSVNYAPKRRSSSLAAGIIGSFGGGRVLTTPEQDLAIFEDHVANISVRDLEAAFDVMWTDFVPLIWLEGPNLETITEASVKNVYHKATQAPVAPAQMRDKLEFAYNNFGETGQIRSQTRVEDYDIEHIMFDNNVRLSLKKTDFEDGWVRLQVTLGEGWNAMPADRPEIAALAGSFSMGGFKAHPVSDLSQIFAGQKIGVNMSVGSKRLIFSGSTNPQDVAAQLRVWTAMVTHPGYRDEWKQQFMDGIEASFHTIDATPGGVAARDLSRLLANGDRRFGYLELEEYASAEIADVRAVLAPILDKGAIEIGVVGDFDRDAIIKAVSETFGALSERRENFIEIPEAFDVDFPESARVTLTHTGAQNQGAIYLAWPIRQSWTVDKSRAYAMLRRIFQNRMTEIIREELSLTYSPSAGLTFNRDYDGYGYFSASMTSDPQFFSAFEVAATKIAENLRAGGITADELERARKPILESFERNEKENGAWLALVALSQTEPERLDWRRSRDAAFRGITPTDLDNFAKELFAPESLFAVEIRPENLQ